MNQTIIDAVRECLYNEMSSICKEITKNDWKPDLEYWFWQFVRKFPDDAKFCNVTIPKSRIKRLKELSEFIGEWITVDNGYPVFIPRYSFQKKHEAWILDGERLDKPEKCITPKEEDKRRSTSLICKISSNMKQVKNYNIVKVFGGYTLRMRFNSKKSADELLDNLHRCEYIATLIRMTNENNQ